MLESLKRVKNVSLAHPPKVKAIASAKIKTDIKVKTMIKNRIHDILRKSHINPPDLKDIFGKYGRMWSEEIELSENCPVPRYLVMLVPFYFIQIR